MCRCTVSVSQSTRFTLTMTVRAPVAGRLSHIPALLMLSACWMNRPRGPIRATHRDPKETLSWGRKCQTSRKSKTNWNCHAALVTPAQRRRRTRMAPSSHEKEVVAKLDIYEFKLLRVLFFSMFCFCDIRLCKLLFFPAFIYFFLVHMDFYHETQACTTGHLLFQDFSTAWSEPSVSILCLNKQTCIK